MGCAILENVGVIYWRVGSIGLGAGLCDLGAGKSWGTEKIQFPLQGVSYLLATVMALQ
jgi:hypothetical protein